MLSQDLYDVTQELSGISNSAGFQQRKKRPAAERENRRRPKAGTLFWLIRYRCENWGAACRRYWRGAAEF